MFGSVEGVSSSSVSQIVFMADPQDGAVKRHVLTRAPEIKGAVAIIFIYLQLASLATEPAESPIASGSIDIGASERTLEVPKLVMKRFGYPSILEPDKQDLAVGEHIVVFMCRDTRGLQFRTPGANLCSHAREHPVVGRQAPAEEICVPSGRCNSRLGRNCKKLKTAPANVSGQTARVNSHSHKGVTSRSRLCRPHPGIDR
ncbi:hypothetical protein NKJ06_03505 [Mesorhizobium sp. M0293]|uniref:hypothetical protein n=1 Tax=Mesorhizobium sp. M0293 TaxID=2956930 RepID=UPI0033368A4E